MLTADQTAAFHRDGFLMLPGFLDAGACSRLVQRAEQLVDGFDADAHRTIFQTRDQRHAADTYFLSSGDRIRFFFEEEAFDADGRLRQEKRLSINKIGHALHDLDPEFDAVSRDRRLAAIATDLGLLQPVLMQSMYIFKQPRIGGEVTCHQDATFLYTDPPSVVGLWFALQHATVENGCLWALPGGHRAGLKSLFGRTAEGGVAMRTLNPTPWPEMTPENGYVPLEASAGTLVLLHGLLPHLSGPNRSDRSRHAYAVHVVDGALPWPADNWLQRGEDNPARGF